MYPILFSLGPVHVFSYSVFLILAWMVFSFLFWRSLRDDGTDEEKIFDITFALTVAGLFAGRAWFVITNWDVFDQALLKIPALWVQPGLSLPASFIGGLLAALYLGKKLKVKLSYVIDALAKSYPVASLLGLFGGLLDGASIGTITTLPWGISYVGHGGVRHPIQLYQMGALVLFTLFIYWKGYQGVRRLWTYGTAGLLFLVWYGTVMFWLEFLTESRVYWYGLRPSQWLWMGLVAETIGVWLVREKVLTKIRFKLASLGRKKV